MNAPPTPVRGAPWAIAISALVAVAIGATGLLFPWGRGGRDTKQVQLVPVPPPRGEENLPEFGAFVYVEEVPRPLTKVAPEYPIAPKWAEVEGTVIVHALIGRDGRVRKTKVLNPIPGLDEAAENAVRQWTFEPARGRNKEPVAVWVAVPVRFTLK